jgi:hypothetical protein
VEHDESENIGNEILLREDGFEDQTRDRLVQADQNRSEPDSPNPTRVDEEQSQFDPQTYELTRDRVRRIIRPPSRYGYSDFAYCLAIAEDVDSCNPSTYKEAVNSKEAKNWISAMKEELDSLKRNETWSLVNPPKNKKVVGCKWVFKHKIDGSNVHYKVRLVAK